MSKAIDNLLEAQKRARAGRPRIGGFPYLAETLRRAGVTRNLWFLPACESLYLTSQGPVVTQGTPLASGTVDVPPFNREAVQSIANRPGRREHFLGVPDSFVARRSGEVRCRFHQAQGRLLRL